MEKVEVGTLDSHELFEHRGVIYEVLVIDWEQRRYELAKDIIKAVVADDCGGNSDAIAKYAVNCADALIKRLKEVNNE